VRNGALDGRVRGPARLVRGGPARRRHGASRAAGARNVLASA
jgi:hypothetical protein